MKIKYQILAYVFLPSIIILLFLTTYFVWLENERRLVLFEFRIQKTNELMSNVLQEALWHYDNNWLLSNCKSFFNDETIYSMQVINDKGEVIFQNKKTLEVKKEDLKAHTIEVKKDGFPIGNILVEYSKKDIRENSKRMEKRFFVFVFFISFIVLISIYIVSKIIYAPVNKVVMGLKKVDNGDYSYRMNFSKNDDFKIIEIYFNRMIENLENIMLENKRYIADSKEKSNELEAAYNQMISINETLADTLNGLEISENKYRNIFNYAPDSMFILNLETKKIEEYNRDFLNLISSKQLSSSNLYLNDIFSKKDIEKIFIKVEKRELLYNYETELELLEKDVIISVIPLEYDFLYVQIVIKDITETKKLQKELEEYAKNLEIKVEERTKEIIEANKKIKEQQEKLIEDAYNRGLVEVTAGIIHNIGNVVNIVDLNLEELISQFPSSDIAIKFFNEIVYVKLLELSEKDESVKKITIAFPRVMEVFNEFRNIVNKNFIFLRKKVLHLKDIVQLQKSFIGSLGTEDYSDINHIIDEVLEIYIPSIQKRNIELILKKGELPNILCDKSQIFQVFGNLIKNAYEAIDSSDEKGKLVIETFSTNNKVVICIEDNGGGIKKENLEKIFDFGFTTKKNIKGTGIGLHNSKEIVKKYGGIIKVESDNKSWTKFIIELPLKKENNI